MSTVPPIRRQIILDADPETAFAVFTEQLGQWWPLAELSVYGAGATVAFDEGQTATRLATEDDASVVAGLLAVTVRPWQVMMQAWPRAVTPR